MRVFIRGAASYFLPPASCFPPLFANGYNSYRDIKKNA